MPNTHSVTVKNRRRSTWRLPRTNITQKTTAPASPRTEPTKPRIASVVTFTADGNEIKNNPRGNTGKSRQSETTEHGPLQIPPTGSLEHDQNDPGDEGGFNALPEHDHERLEHFLLLLLLFPLKH